MNEKELAARQAAKQVKDGMIIGLGTGSTADCFIRELARLQNEEGLRIQVVSSSIVSAIKAQELGLSLVPIENLSGLDLYVDGADEVDAELTLLKGQGFDLVREKILAEAANKFLVIIDESKRVNRIGERFPIPIEVMPFAWKSVKRKLENIGGQGELRLTANKNGFVMTSHGSLVLDMKFDPRMDSKTLNETLNKMAGIVEHGIFYGLTSAVFVGAGGRVEEQWAN